MSIVARIILVLVMLVLWFLTQKLIGNRGFAGEGIQDKVHDWSARWNQALENNPGRARMLLILSSLGIDLMVIYIFLSGVMGASVRPLIGLFLLFFLRQFSQYVSALPAPKGMIWRNPGFPSLFVTYGVSNDLFFSGHTALAVYGGAMLYCSGSWLLAVLGVALVLFEICTVLVLRAHWTMDVYAGAVTALLVFDVVNRIGPFVDGIL